MKNISGTIPSRNKGFNAVSTAIIKAFPFAFFSSWIFLFKEGPAATTIPVTSIGIARKSCIVLYPLYKYFALRNTFIDVTSAKVIAVLYATRLSNAAFLHFSISLSVSSLNKIS